MDVYNLKDYIGQWFIGFFEPSVLQTKDFEVAIHDYKKDQEHPKHYHAIATEYNVLIKGIMIIEKDGKEEAIQPRQIFVIHPNEVVKPRFLTDCTVLIIKTPSVANDKFIVEDKQYEV